MKSYEIIYKKELNYKPVISATLIVKDCEDRIIQCLRSIEDLVDEIIIVDDYSSDNSIKVILENSNKVTHLVKNRLIDFSTQRNIALELSSGEYNLNIDDDERLTDELKKSIRSAIKNRKLDKDIYYCKRKNHNFHGSAIEVNSYPLLLKSNIRFHGEIHERVQGSVGNLNGFINHYSDDSVKSFISDISIYSKNKAKGWINQGREYSITFLLFRQIYVAFYLLIKRLFKEKRIKDGTKALIYCLAWMSEEFFVAMFYIDLKKNKII
tara:strand:- start:15630 stop:16430 length:801 start_codon:yes stop_codon:yes gene_type:complete